MAIISSDEMIVQSGNDQLSEYLSTPENLYDLLPVDRIEDWQYDATTCSFKIKGLAHISIKLDQSDLEKVVYLSNSEKPFNFSLNIRMSDSGNSCGVKVEFDADVNGFMATMLKTPMKNFLNHLVESLQSKYAQE